VLAHFLPLPFVLSLAAALDLGSAAALGVHTEKQADVRELLALPTPRRSARRSR